MNLFGVALLVVACVFPIFAVRNNAETNPMEGMPLGSFPFELEFGPCPSPRSVQNFNPMKFSGTFYDIQRYKNKILQGKCGTAVFTWNVDQQIMNMTYTNLETVEYLQLLPEDLSNGVFTVNRDGKELPIHLVLLETDYANYAILWTCFEVPYASSNTQALHILGRTRTLSPEILASAHNAITSRRLDEDRLHNVVQRDSVCRNY